jgi:hypothetical protein
MPVALLEYNLHMEKDFESAPAESYIREELPKDDKEQERQKLYEGLTSSVRELMALYSKEECIQTIKTNAAAYAKANPGLFDRLDELANIENDNEFIVALSYCLRPLVDVKIDQPELYESIQQQVILERPGYVKVNDLFAYEPVGNDVYQLHIFPVRTRSDKLGLIKEGMKQLAEVVDKDPNIKEIRGTSWIVASNPGLMKMLGFTIDAPMSEQERKEYFPNDTRDIRKAHITREELLGKYLNSG